MGVKDVPTPHAPEEHPRQEWEHHRPLTRAKSKNAFASTAETALYGALAGGFVDEP